MIAKSFIGDGVGRSMVCQLLLIVLLGLAVYANTMTAPMVLDDRHYVSDNPAAHDFSYYYSPALSEEAIRKLELDPNFLTRRVVYFSFAVNQWLHGNRVTGYHLVNLIVHLVCGLLVYWLTILVLRSPRMGAGADHEFSTAESMAPLLAALLFVVHPVQTEAVTYISQRFTLMATMFYLLSLALYARWRLAVNLAASGEEGVKSQTCLPRQIIYWLAVIAAVLAMYSKEISFTLPLVVILFEIFFFGPLTWKNIRFLLPFIATLPIIPLSILRRGAMFEDVQRLASSLHGSPEGNPVLVYLFTQFRVIVTYLRLLVFPAGQNLDYDYPLYSSFWQAPVVLSFLFLCSLAGLAVFLYISSSKRSDTKSRGQRLIAFGIGWFLLTLSVESSLMPLDDLIFEHRLYLPMVGFILVLSGLGDIYLSRPAVPRRLVAALLFAGIGIFAVAAHSRNLVWQDPLSLWTDAGGKSPGKARPHLQLALQYIQSGDWDRAKQEYETVLRISSNYRDKVQAYKGLEEFYSQRHDEESLKGIYRALLPVLEQGVASEKDRVARAFLFNNLAIIQMRLGLFFEAENALNRALSLHEEVAEFHLSQGILYVFIKRLDLAVISLQKALALEPGNSRAREMLDRVILELDRTN